MGMSNVTRVTHQDEVSKMFINLFSVSEGLGNDFHSRGQASNL